jgi:hypothetical protein
MKLFQVERALGLWKTGRYVISNTQAENSFSSDNWGSRTKTLIQAAQILSDATWELIYADVRKVLAAESDNEEDSGDVLPLICSDITDILGQSFEYFVFLSHGLISILTTAYPCSY